MLLLLLNFSTVFVMMKDEIYEMICLKTFPLVHWTESNFGIFWHCSVWAVARPYDHKNDNFVQFCIKKTVWLIILFNFASKRPYEWYIWLKFSPKIALFPCYVFWFVFISAAIKWGTVMIGQSRDFSCLLTNFPGRIKKKHCARRKHSKITKEGKFLFSENGGYEQVSENCFP